MPGSGETEELGSVEAEELSSSDISCERQERLIPEGFKSRAGSSRELTG